MWISKYFVYFIVFSFCGWIYETLLDTIKFKRWNNRGFLFGPIIPIYGVGADAIIAISNLFISLGLGTKEMPMTWWQIFLISFFGSMVLEYFTSWFLEKKFHAIWWDYSNVPLNLNGRICVPAAFGFGIAGIFVVYVVAPISANLSSSIPPIVLEGLSLIFMCLVTIDTTLTVSSLTQFELYMKQLDDTINAHMTAFVEELQEKPKELVEEMQAKPKELLTELQEKPKEFMSDLQDKRLDFSQLISEEKERITLESAKHMFHSTGAMYHSTIKRVKNFRYPQMDSGKVDSVVHSFRTLKRKVKKSIEGEK